MADVIMPQMGESVAEGTVTKWLKNPGDPVARDEPLFEISTDKVDAEIPSPAAGCSGRSASRPAPRCRSTPSGGDRGGADRGDDPARPAPGAPPVVFQIEGEPSTAARSAPDAPADLPPESARQEQAPAEESTEALRLFRSSPSCGRSRPSTRSTSAISPARDRRPRDQARHPRHIEGRGPAAPPPTAPAQAPAPPPDLAAGAQPSPRGPPRRPPLRRLLQCRAASGASRWCRCRRSASARPSRWCSRRGPRPTSPRCSRSTCRVSRSFARRIGNPSRHAGSTSPGCRSS